MKLSIITINYNSSENTTKLLRSLAEQTDMDFKIFVVDNASEEDDFINLLHSTKSAFTKADFVKLIRNSQNLGFSGGNNVGIRKALETGADWVLLLNNDTWVERGFMASVKIILGQKQGIIGLPIDDGGNKVAYAGEIEWLKPTLEHSYQETRDRRQARYYIIGAAMAIHKDVFESVGVLDEKYFLYFEDADFSIRARKAGIPILIARSFMIYHKASTTTKKLGSPLLLRYHYRNALYFNRKNGSWHIKLFIWPWSWWIIIKQILKIMIYHNREESRAILKGVLDFYHHKMGKIT